MITDVKTISAMYKDYRIGELLGAFVGMGCCLKCTLRKSVMSLESGVELMSNIGVLRMTT